MAAMTPTLRGNISTQACMVLQPLSGLAITDGAAQNAPRPQGWHGDKHTTVLIYISFILYISFTKVREKAEKNDRSQVKFS